MKGSCSGFPVIRIYIPLVTECPTEKPRQNLDPAALPSAGNSKTPLYQALDVPQAGGTMALDIGLDASSESQAGNSFIEQTPANYAQVIVD